jgi:hypothetical protein
MSKKANEIAKITLCSSILIIATITLTIIGCVYTAKAAAFRQSFRINLGTVCQNPSFQAGANLLQVCSEIAGGGGPVGGVFSSTGASPQGARIAAVEQRLQSSRETKEEKLETKSDRRTYALNSAERFAQGDGLQLPPAGGASPAVAFGLGQGVGVFFSAGAFALDHYNNRFEDGYEAQLPTVTVGGDYRVND